MLATNTDSYLNEYVRRRSGGARGGAHPTRCAEPDRGRLLTDRSEYIAFLESQLDAVTKACLTAQTFDDRLTSLSAAACTFDEKLLNLARLVKCSQSVAEEQEGAYHAALERMGERVKAVERATATLTEAEQRKVLDASSMLREKGLLGGSSAGHASGVGVSEAAGATTMGVLDAQFRTWAAAQERSIDARLRAAEVRLTARMDAAAANVMEALRMTEGRLREAAPHLAEECARRMWGAEHWRGALPEGGLVGRADLIEVTQRVEALEALERRLLEGGQRGTQDTMGGAQGARREPVDDRNVEQHHEGRAEQSRGWIPEDGDAVAGQHRTPRAGPPYAVYAHLHHGPGTAAPVPSQSAVPSSAEHKPPATAASLNGAIADVGVGGPGLGFGGDHGARGDGGNGGGGGDMLGLGAALLRSVEASATRFDQLGAQLASFQERLDDQHKTSARLSQLVESMHGRVTFGGEDESERGVSRRAVAGAGGGEDASGERGDAERAPAALALVAATASRAAKASANARAAMHGAAWRTHSDSHGHVTGGHGRLASVMGGTAAARGPGAAVSVVTGEAASRPGSRPESRVSSVPASPVKVPTTVSGANKPSLSSHQPAAVRATFPTTGTSQIHVGDGSRNVIDSAVGGNRVMAIDAAMTVDEAEARRMKLAQLYRRLDEITSPPKN